MHAMCVGVTWGDLSKSITSAINGKQVFAERREWLNLANNNNTVHASTCVLLMEWLVQRIKQN